MRADDAFALAADQVAQLAPGRPVQTNGAWTSVALDTAAEIKELTELLRASYAAVRQAKAAAPSEPEIS